MTRLAVAALIVALSFTAVDVAQAASAVLALPPEALRRRLEGEPFTIVSASEAGAGVMGARKLELRFADGLAVKAKWKATSPQADGWNNSPRREIGAYAVQRLFLGQDDWLVPPITVRCIALEDYRVVEAEPVPNIAGTYCVFGALMAWLENVSQPDPPFDRERFTRDRRYATHFANLNLLHYLIEHRDGRFSNFLIAKDPADARLFSIDNGISFGEPIFNFLSLNYDTILVSSLPRRSIERLRRVRPADLAALGVLGQLEADAGVLRSATPTANVDPDSGTRFTERGLQFGLTRGEIDALAERLRALLARIDAGELLLF